ncbi:MAG: radical SAM protein, partial [Candidatus Helarchaeota archaeon]
LHGINCIASTVVQSCIYWRDNLPCQFCGIELSLRSGTTTAVKTPTQLREVIGAAIDEGVCQHVTLTIGSLPRPDKGVGIYVNIVREITQYYDVPIHVQLEPPKNIENLGDLYDAGVITVGIHYESFDREILQTMCPGKIQIPLDKYIKAWKFAVNLFGECQVDSYIIVGLGESDTSILKGSELLLQLGVIPYVVPFRPITGSLLESHSTPPPSRLNPLFKQLAQLLHDYGIDPRKNKAGCVRCGACSPLTEAFKYF